MLEIPGNKHVSASNRSCGNVSRIVVWMADTVIVKPLAEAQKIPLPQMQLLLPNYLVASFSKNVAMYVSNLLNKGTWQWSLAELGAAISSYLGSSMLMTKLYSVGAFATMGGNVDKVRHEEALLAMLRGVGAKTIPAHASATRTVVPSPAVVLLRHRVP